MLRRCGGLSRRRRRNARSRARGRVACGRERCRHRDLGRGLAGVPVDAGRDRGECDRGRPHGSREFDRSSVTRRQQRRFSAGAAGPDGSDGVDDPARREFEAGRDDRVAGRAAPDRGARRVKVGARSSEDRATHSGAASECIVGCVDDRVSMLGRDVTANCLDLHVPIPSDWADDRIDTASAG